METLVMEESIEDWLDLEHLQSLVDSSGVEFFVEMLLEGFEDMFSKYFESVASAAETLDYEAAGAALHSLKGGCSTVGMKKLTQMLQEAETQTTVQKEFPSYDQVQNILEAKSKTLELLKASKYVRG